MNKIQKFILRKIAERVVIQCSHKEEIIEFYRILAKAAQEQFIEDNKITLDFFLTECHKISLEKNKCKCCGREF